MLMAPENNTELNQDSVSKTEDQIAVNTSPSSKPPVNLDENTISNENPTVVTDNTPVNKPPENTPLNNSTPPQSDSSSSTYKSESPHSVSTSPPSKSKMSPLKIILALIILIILFGVVGAVAYHEGKSNEKIVYKTSVATPKPISLPPTAIVTEACVPGRGKQYIIPSQIPEGPIYDVENSKVIAIEYLISIQQLLSNSSQFSSQFSSIILSLSKNYPVDHFAMVPAAAPAGQTGEFINLIMFVVTAKEANSITCGGNSSSSSNSSSTTTTGSSTSSSSTNTNSTKSGTSTTTQ